MKKMNNLSESCFLKRFFLFVTVCFAIGAVIMPDRGQMFAGLKEILLNPCKVTTNYFAYGFSATFMNMALVGLFCVALCYLPGAAANNATNLAFLLTVGFGAWGINPLNMIPTILGVCLYCLVKKEKLGGQVNAMMFSTGIAPLISELLFRYPNVGADAAVHSVNALGIGLALGVGLIIGFFLPAGLGHAPNIHKGFNHYSAAVPIGFTAFFLRVVLYKVMLGKGIGDVLAIPGNAAAKAEFFWGCNIFCLVLFGACIVGAFLMGCKVKDYWKLLKDPGQGVSFTTKYGNAPFLMNVGVFGLMIVAYFNFATLIDGTAYTSNAWNGMTFGIVFCMLCTCNSGSHPGNVWPIMLGYVATSCLFGWIAGLMGVASYSALSIGAQGILIGMCYANGLSPIAGKYGWAYGALAGGIHYLLVTAIPDMHGGFCLYNGGFTAALVCLVLVPQLEKFCKTKEERKLAKAQKITQ